MKEFVIKTIEEFIRLQIQFMESLGPTYKNYFNDLFWRSNHQTLGLYLPENINKVEILDDILTDGDIIVFANNVIRTKFIIASKLKVKPMLIIASEIGSVYKTDDETILADRVYAFNFKDFSISDRDQLWLIPTNWYITL